ncbi:hypothetical protein B9Z19DRAFT_1069417 [Tuber borchii]|uniref:Uncharacterized protein n=1 Tax=Tuber borchii TaxID=42251 RepID=A0A2T6ZBR7_TUBBO|nr:hypothetical protein B9Z19DRAFT_1069417 [Tuber borchii]
MYQSHKMLSVLRFNRTYIEGLCFIQDRDLVPSASHSCCFYEGNTTSPPPVGPNSVLCYPTRSPISLYSHKGHLLPQCPTLRMDKPESRTVSSGPDHPNCSVESTEKSPQQSQNGEVGMVEIETRPSAFDEGVKFQEATMTKVDTPDTSGEVQKKDNEDDRSNIPDSEGSLACITNQNMDHDEDDDEDGEFGDEDKAVTDSLIV